MAGALGLKIQGLGFRDTRVSSSLSRHVTAMWRQHGEMKCTTCAAGC